MSTAPKTEFEDEMPEVTARRLKKRELDRKAQRMARNRTKSRIAHLEELVDRLSHNDTNAEVLRLTERLFQKTQEHDKLTGVLASLGTTIQHHMDALSTQQAKGSPGSVVTAMQALADHESPVDVKPFQQTPNQGALTISHGRLDEHHTSDLNIPPPPNSFDWKFDAPGKPHGAGSTSSMPPYIREAVIGLDELSQNPSTILRSDSKFSSESNNSGDGYIIPPPPQPCECDTIAEQGPHGNAERNTWRESNYALGRPVKLTQLAMEAEDRASQDTPVRAVVEGWHSVERAGMMTASWRKLRVVDDLCVSKCDPVERLAILKMMHILISCHGDPAPERMATLPRWFRPRPSQSAIPHSYAIDFLVWPGIRERFVFSQHRYCANLFWQLFQSNLTILWQFGFNDCFVQNSATSRFQLAPLFEERIRDIRSWTMNVDFLNKYPELCEDIPMQGGIPSKLTMPRNVIVGTHARWHTDTTPRPREREIERDQNGIDTVQEQQAPILSNDITKGSTLIATAQAPALPELAYMSQNPRAHVPMTEASSFAYEHTANMRPATLMQTELTPAGQHVYSEGAWFYSYCQHNYK
ncbi:hypothetical protein ACHAQH_008962 [Verticillium albo-atrum]